MLVSHRKTIVAVVAALVVVIGGGAAVAATGALSPREESEAAIDDAAEQLGVESSELSDALKTALKNRVDAAVEAGRVTEAQGEAMKERIDAGEVPLLGFGPRVHHFHGPHGGLDAAASYLGMTEAALRAQLRDGDTLAELARSKGKSVAGLVDAMVADAKKDLAAAVTAGRITRAQSNAIQADLKARITELVNNGRPAGPGHRFGRGFGPPPAPSEEAAATA